MITDRAVNLGSTGGTALGTQPELYLRGSASAYNVNSGYAGNMTQVGTITDTTPPTMAGI